MPIIRCSYVNIPVTLVFCLEMGGFRPGSVGSISSDIQQWVTHLADSVLIFCIWIVLYSSRTHSRGPIPPSSIFPRWRVDRGTWIFPLVRWTMISWCWAAVCIRPVEGIFELHTIFWPTDTHARNVSFCLGSGLCSMYLEQGRPLVWWP